MIILDRFFKRSKSPIEILFKKVNLNEWLHELNKKRFEGWNKSEIEYLISNNASYEIDLYSQPQFILKVKGGHLRICKAKDEWYYVSHVKVKLKLYIQMAWLFNADAIQYEYYICDTWQAVDQLIDHLK